MCAMSEHRTPDPASARDHPHAGDHPVEPAADGAAGPKADEPPASLPAGALQLQRAGVVRPVPTAVEDSGDDTTDVTTDDADAAPTRTDPRMVLASSLAKTLSVAMKVLRWPTALLMIVPVVPIAVLIIMLTRLNRLSDIIVLGVVVLAALVINVMFLRRRFLFRRALAEPSELAQEFRALLTPTVVTDEVFGVLRNIAAKGGLLVLRRLRAAWSLVRLPDHLISQLDRYPKAKLFVPPSLNISGFISLAQIWLAVLSWPVMLAVIVLWLSGVVG